MSIEREKEEMDSKTKITMLKVFAGTHTGQRKLAKLGLLAQTLGALENGTESEKVEIFERVAAFFPDPKKV
jgi:DNA-binding XRE family transcriptional regulator